MTYERIALTRSVFNPVFCDDLAYGEVKFNTVTQSLIIEEDLQGVISETELNKKPYEALLKKYKGDVRVVVKDILNEENMGTNLLFKGLSKS